MNRPVRATDIVNFVMKNGDIRPLLVVRSWDLTPPAAAVVASIPTVPLRAGEQVKFPAHNQPGQFAVAHVAGVLLIDPSIDSDNVPLLKIIPVAAKPSVATTAELQATAAAGNAPGATPTQVTASKDAQAELDRRAKLPPPAAALSQSGGIDFRDRGTGHTESFSAAAPAVAPAPAPQPLPVQPASIPAGAFEVWIGASAFDDQGKAPGTWSWPKG